MRKIISLAAAAMSCLLCWAQLPTEQQKQQFADGVESYLNANYASHVTRVEVTSHKVTISGHVDGNTAVRLAEVMPQEDVTALATVKNATPVYGRGDFSITLQRFVKRKSTDGIKYDYDRLLSRWVLVDNQGKLVSHARYADDVTPRHMPEAMPLKGKKGLGGYSFDRKHAHDLVDLNIKSVTVNMNVSRMFSVVPWGEPDTTVVYQGQKYYVNRTEMDRLDRTLDSCTSRGVVTAAIILVGPEPAIAENKGVLVDPEYTKAFYAMPNLTTMQSIQAYAAFFDFLASRYSENAHGRINHWIMLNEVDYCHEWSSMGEQPLMRYMDRYMKLMRMCYNIVRQYDQNAAIMGSYTHCWTQADGRYKPKQMLELTQQYCNVEGDFWWGVAVHPYPQDLTEPEFWINDKLTSYSLDSKFVTFNNLEVYDAWIKQPQVRYKDGRKRLLFLSENGTNSRDYGERQLRLQAAGACWAWKKAAALDGIDAIQWHNLQDDPNEFSLRIGLRKWDGPDAHTEAKPAWYVWQAAESEREDEVFAPYLSVFGIKSWQEIFHKVE